MDTVKGKVTRIVDADRFRLQVTQVGLDNEGDYRAEEEVVIADINEPDLQTEPGGLSKEALEAQLLGKRVRCFVQSRDVEGRIIAQVQVF